MNLCLPLLRAMKDFQGFCGRALFCALVILAGAGPARSATVDVVPFIDTTPRAALTQGAATGLVALPRGAAASGARGSLFAGTQGGSFFAPLPPRATRVVARAPMGSDPRHRLLALIAEAEAGAAGYDAIQHGARIRPAKPPTAMTLAEIDAWTRATPGQPHAIGRYQFIPATLRRLVKRHDVPSSTVFSPRVQDALARSLLEDAGYSAFRAGRLSRDAFMHNLARIWAGLPTATGKSHYEGYAGNAATLSRARFEREMARIFPD